MTRILIDGRNLGLEKGTGVATYARNLSYELHAMGHGVEVLYGYSAGPSRNALMREIAFFDSNHGDRDRIAAAIEAVRSRMAGPLAKHAYDVPISGRVISRTFSARLPYYDRIVNSTNVFGRSHATFSAWRMLSRLTMKDPPDIAHWTYPLPIRLKGRPNVYTLHDVVPLKLPYTSLDNKRFYLRLMKRIARVADHIVTVSECSKRDLVELIGIPEDRITNTYQSVDIPEKFLAKPDDEVAREVEGAVGVDYKGYYLFWGSIEPKKNIGRMIEGYLASKVDAPLVIVGAMAWKSEEELRLLNEENIVFRRTIENDEFTRKRVMILPYAPFSLLVSLIRGARATLFPSIYEGFGLPVLEAMLLGTPVISSNTASLPEVAADAALLVDPYDTTAIASGLRLPARHQNGNLLRDDGRPLKYRGMAQADLTTLLRAEQDAGTQFVAMEWDFPPFEHLHAIPGLRLFTSLRDPLARAMSNFRMDKVAGWIDPDMDFAAYINGDALYRSDNYYTKMLCLLWPKDTASATHGDRALAALATFAAVIVVEQGNLAPVLAQFGMTVPPPRANRFNPRAARERLGDHTPLMVSADQRRAFIARNALDYALYRHATRQVRGAVPSPMPEVIHA